MPTDHLRDLRAAFAPDPGNLDAATCGIPPRSAVVAMQSALADWAAGRTCPVTLGADVERARAAFARIVGVETARVAVGSQTSAAVGTVAASLPDGARVVVVEDDFTSVTYPFLQHAHRGVTVRAVPAAALPDAVAEGCDLVAFSVVASRTGAVADVGGVLAAAGAVGALTLADLTQAAGWLPVEAGRFDVTVTSAYKWLCCPRGVAFTTLSDRAQRLVRPILAGWYAGADVWDSCYGVDPALAPDARRFDVSPAWLAFVGAATSLEAIAAVLTRQPDAIAAHDVALADALLAGLGLAPRGSAVVSLPDPDGEHRAALAAAGLRVAGRGGNVRLSFHLWNDERDVARALEVLRTARRAAA
ncbi:aminotransferase class V-fold PLP-dependent enzyme [Miniimonas arenae]|uniref:Aminotransferase class V-fold PLP-dependent enzyme n=1 Tax=Miniimonas arenae TaxID=676201 RepID=A0A5C5BEK2_9MICO|nr:aminotransferase class V-fold PLP-dependent enzyme [Miniimonas arenae]TNU76613.1 aminotransferase class V-fold PLP-dependent enzyme [Miniimonas arenae]